MRITLHSAKGPATLREDNTVHVKPTSPPLQLFDITDIRRRSTCFNEGGVAPARRVVRKTDNVQQNSTSSRIAIRSASLRYVKDISLELLISSSFTVKQRPQTVVDGII